MTKTIKQTIQVIGLVTELTVSQTENFKIIQSHWVTFNKELKNLNLNKNS